MDLFAGFLRAYQVGDSYSVLAVEHNIDWSYNNLESIAFESLRMEIHLQFYDLGFH